MVSAIFTVIFFGSAVLYREDALCLTMAGPEFLTWHGSRCQLYVTKPEIVKEVLMNREEAFPKMDMEGCAKKLLGESLITNEGEKWGKIRKLANHTFHSESLKVKSTA